MKKIAILVPSLSDGGAEKVAANLSIIYEELGYEVYFILYENRVSFDYEGQIIDLNIKARYGLKKIFKDYEIYRKLKSIKRKYKFDFVISHLPKTDLMNCLTKGNEKVITTIHNNIDVDYPTYMKRMLKYIIRKSDLIASVSRVGEEYLLEKYSAKNVKTIYNPQILKDIKVKSKLEITEFSNSNFECEIIANVGRLSMQKGQWHLIRAFSEILKTRPNAKLVIIGRGDLEERLKILVEKLGIEKNVIFTGFNSNPYKFLSRTDLYVSTSIHEGLPMTYIEAMSLGIPIISTDCISGPREIIAPNKFGEVMDYDEIQEYGVLVSDFASIDTIDSLVISSEEINLANRINSLLDNKEVYKSLSEKVKQRSYDFDYTNIKKIWERELNILGGEN
ncbi:glycosyltransferase [uncultured Clostridium sp.]|uniref:glycosyltransferase n=1 Tax=uncultured Clostridium sp. TaxID=59620 RepID=UPI0026092476|nr:glycosyltransferase [uncultured Clostridium sp.]